MTIVVRDLSGNGTSNHSPKVPIQLVKGSFTGTGSSAALNVIGAVNINIQKGGGSATIDIEKSFDGGSNYNIVSKDADGADASYTTTSDFNGSIEDVGEGAILYRLTCSTYGSGTISYRLSKGT
jgi:hypothetical protein